MKTKIYAMMPEFLMNLDAFQILEALEMDPYCKKMHLAHRLDNVACTLEGEETSMCWHKGSPLGPPSSSNCDIHTTFYHTLLHDYPDYLQQPQRPLYRHQSQPYFHMDVNNSHLLQWIHTHCPTLPHEGLVTTPWPRQLINYIFPL